MAKRKNFISMDLGSENIIVYVSGIGIIYNEPSIMAYNKKNNKLLSIGNEAYKLIGKTHKGIKLIRPINDGVISNFNAIKDMIIAIFERRKLTKIWKNANVILASPSSVTRLENDALKKVAEDMGAKNVIIEEEVKMAAIGAGINRDDPTGRLIIDIGGGTTDIAVISSGDIVKSLSIKNAGRMMTMEIQKFLRTKDSKDSIIIGEKTAQEIKHELGTLIHDEPEKKIEIYGRDMITGMPKMCKISTKEISQILEIPLRKIYDSCSELLSQVLPELAGDVYKNGTIFCGGGSLLKGLTQHFSERFKIPAQLSENPLMAVIEGTKRLEPYIEEIIMEHQNRIK